MKNNLTKLLTWDIILKELVEQSAKDNDRSVNAEIRSLIKKGLEL
jgi:hypothetical protein